MAASSSVSRSERGNGGLGLRLNTKYHNNIRTNSLSYRWNITCHQCLHNVVTTSWYLPKWCTKWCYSLPLGGYQPGQNVVGHSDFGRSNSIREQTDKSVKKVVQWRWSLTVWGMVTYSTGRFYCIALLSRSVYHGCGIKNGDRCRQVGKVPSPFVLAQHFCDTHHPWINLNPNMQIWTLAPHPLNQFFFCLDSSSSPPTLLDTSHSPSTHTQHGHILIYSLFSKNSLHKGNVFQTCITSVLVFWIIPDNNIAADMGM